MRVDHKVKWSHGHLNLDSNTTWKLHNTFCNKLKIMKFKRWSGNLTHSWNVCQIQVVKKFHRHFEHFTEINHSFTKVTRPVAGWHVWPEFTTEPNKLLLQADKVRKIYWSIMLCQTVFYNRWFLHGICFKGHLCRFFFQNVICQTGLIDIGRCNGLSTAQA